MLSFKKTQGPLREVALFRKFSCNMMTDIWVDTVVNISGFHLRKLLLPRLHNQSQSPPLYSPFVYTKGTWWMRGGCAPSQTPDNYFAPARYALCAQGHWRKFCVSRSVAKWRLFPIEPNPFEGLRSAPILKTGL